MVRLVVTDDSGGAAQLIERRASNWKVVKPWIDSRCGISSRFLKKDA